MSDVKIDKISNMIFLSTVKELLEGIDISKQPKNLLSKYEYILDYIGKEQRLDDFMLQRKLYYEFYIKNRTLSPQSANEMYQKYLKVKLEIKELREE